MWVAPALAVLGAIAAALFLFGMVALRRAREEISRSRFLSDLVASIELKDVMRRTLDAAVAVAGTDAALITVENGQGKRATESVGLSRDEIEKHELEQPPHEHARSMLITYEEAEVAAHGQQRPITAGLAVSIRTQGETVGILSIFSRARPAAFSKGRLRKLEDLAARSAPMIQNGRRFREVADLDPLTSLYSRRYFVDALAREMARGQRYELRLGLLVLDLDGFKAINRIGFDAGDAVLVELAERIRAVVRSADIPCRIGGDEFAVILPESGLDGAEQLYLRLRALLAAEPIIHVGHAGISAGAAELRREDDPDPDLSKNPLFHRADQAQVRAKDWGKGRIAWGEGDRSEPPPEAEYRLGTKSSQCDRCEQFRSGQRDFGYCELWHAPVEGNRVCKRFEPG